MALHEFDRVTCQRLAKELLAAVEPVAAKYCLGVKPGGGSFDTLTWTEKLTFTVQETKDGKSAEQAQFEQLCAIYHLRPEHFGMGFTWNGTRYRLTGVQPSRPKFAIQGRRLSDEKTFLFPLVVLRVIDKEAYEQVRPELKDTRSEAAWEAMVS